MQQLSDRINNLPVSQTLAMAAKARELKNQGKDIISLSLGEPDFNTPDFIKEAAKRAIDENYNSYTPVNGYLELREAICRKFKRDNGLTYDESQVVVSTGAKAISWFGWFSKPCQYTFSILGCDERYSATAFPFSQ